MQFDVFRNPVTAAQKAFPYVVVLQSDAAETGQDRVVAFLAPQAGFSGLAGRLLPAVEVAGEQMVLLVPSLTNLPSTALRMAIANVSGARDRIVEALDWLFLGV
jgi:hypothetical protein